MNECCTDMEINPYEFKWTIKKFILHTKCRSSFNLRSFSFSVGSDNGSTNWYLVTVLGYHSTIWVRAIKESVDSKPIISAWISLYFERDDGTKFGAKRALFKMDAGVVNSFEFYNSDVGEFLKIAGVSDLDDELTLICRINMIGDTVTSDGNRFIPKAVKKPLSRDFAKLLESGKFSDVTFVLNNEKIKAHKSILTSCSPVFAAMFDHPMKEQDTNEVDIDDIDFDVFKKMLQYIYTDEVPDLDGMAANLLYAADKYGLDELKEMCGESIWKEITVDNAMEAYVFAERHSLEQLVDSIQNFIGERIFQVMETVGYKDMEEKHPKLAIKIYRKSMEKLQYAKK